MDPITQQQALAAAGAAGGEGLYVDDVFSTYLYEGNGSTQTITNGIDLSGEGGLIWFKRRDAVGNNTLTDTVDNKRLITDNTNAQNSNALVSSFNSDGFSLNTSLTPNQSGSDYCSWTFRKAPGFFDVVTYTGTGANRSIAHSLGSVPGCILIKCLSRSGDDWIVYHRSLGNTKFLNLNQTYAASTDPAAWNSSTPTSTVFYLGDKGQVNDLNQSYVAYIFAHDDQSFGEDEDESIIKCGSYTGTAAVGNFINLGWEPQWVLVKKASGGNANNYNWTIVDNMRGAPVLQVNSVCPYLHPNTSGAESLDYPISPSPTGFIVNNGGSLVNDSGATFIYIAIRRPHKPPEAGTDVFAIDFDSASSTIPTWDSGFPVDMAFALDTLGGSGAQVSSSRLVGPGNLQTSSTAAEFSDASLVWDSNLGWGKNYSGSRDYISWMFRRAPGFFDVVAYTGTGTATTVNHNLAVAPEMMIIKKRNGTTGWVVYHQALGASAYLFLHSNGAEGSASTFFNATTPTASSFSVGTSTYTNASSSTYIAYLFASLAGISKVGSFSGTGSNVDVDCGFTAGARFVLIKRSDIGGTGDWYVWDSTRGIVSGNDPYLLLNSTAAEVTSTDYIDPLNSGFTVTSSAPAALNASGGSYIFLAIA